MSGPFSALSFLKKIPSELLCAYFKRFEEIDLNLFSKGVLKSTELITFWKELPDEVRRTAESDFSLILDMMDELGVQSIESTAQQAGCGASLLKAWDGKTLEEKIFIAFLDFKNLWDSASAIAFADNVPGRYWQRRKNLPSNLMDDSEEACEDFAQKLGDFLHSKQGRGKQCKVERYQAEDGRLFLFALFEDFARSSLEWEKTIYRHIAGVKHCNIFFSILRKMVCCQFIVQMQLRLLKTYNNFLQNQFFILMN